MTYRVGSGDSEEHRTNYHLPELQDRKSLLLESYKKNTDYAMDYAPKVWELKQCSGERAFIKSHSTSAGFCRTHRANTPVPELQNPVETLPSSHVSHSGDANAGDCILADRSLELWNVNRTFLVPLE